MVTDRTTTEKERQPIFLRPTGKEYLWGGKRLNDEFEKGLEMSPLAETWECSTHPDGPSFAVGGEFDGMELADVLAGNPDMLGERNRGVTGLPVLIKFIDAKKDLSVQVHPTDEYAAKHEAGQLGKSEMWYVLDASHDAKITYGLAYDRSKAEIRESIERGNLNKYLQSVPVKKDDVFFIEAGTIHAIGAGCLIAEIQESSNLTYRLYDYDRVDRNGNKRQLHVEKALDVANLSVSTEPRQPMRVLNYESGMARELLCRCKYFEAYRMIVNTERKQRVSYKTDKMGFAVLLCINGCGVIGYRCGENNTLVSRNYYKGDCIFVPADSVQMEIHGMSQFLDVRG